jgi:uncharacterized protein YcbX
LGIGGLVGDRQFGLVDGRTGLPAAPEEDHRWRKALHLQARSAHCDFPAIVFPGADAHDVRDRLLNAALSEYFGFAAGIATYAYRSRGLSAHSLSASAFPDAFVDEHIFAAFSNATEC